MFPGSEMQAGGLEATGAHGCGYRTSTDGWGLEVGLGEVQCGLGSRKWGLWCRGKGGKGLVKQVGDFRPLIQRTVDSYGNILSRGLATSELRLRKV